MASHRSQRELVKMDTEGTGTKHAVGGTRSGSTNAHKAGWETEGVRIHGLKGVQARKVVSLLFGVVCFAASRTIYKEGGLGLMVPAGDGPLAECIMLLGYASLGLGVIWDPRARQQDGRRSKWWLKKASILLVSACLFANSQLSSSGALGDIVGSGIIVGDKEAGKDDLLSSLSTVGGPQVHHDL
jgi:hypothetical protein